MELNSHEILLEIKKGLEEINTGNFVEFKNIRRNVWYNTIKTGIIILYQFW
jgi:predicted transcriptional regulator